MFRGIRSEHFLKPFYMKNDLFSAKNWGFFAVRQLKIFNKCLLKNNYSKKSRKA